MERLADFLRTAYPSRNVYGVRLCSNCEHCNTDDRDEGWKIAGYCTVRGAFFDGRAVPNWAAAGCPDFSARALPQGDGDPGGEAA